MRVQRPGRAVVAAVSVWAIAVIAFGLTYTSLPMAVACLAVAGAADVISTVFRGAILQWASPDPIRGRVSGVQALIFQGGPRLGDLEATAVAVVFGLTASILSGGLLCLIAMALIVGRYPEYLTYRTRPPLATTGATVPGPAQQG